MITLPPPKPVRVSEEDLLFWTKNAAHPQKFQDALTKLRQMQKDMSSTVIIAVWEVDGLFSIRPAEQNVAIRKRVRASS